LGLEWDNLDSRNLGLGSGKEELDVEKKNTGNS